MNELSSAGGYSKCAQPPTLPAAEGMSASALKDAP